MAHRRLSRPFPVVLIMAAMLAPASCQIAWAAPAKVDAWLVQHLTDAEAAAVRRLSKQIVGHEQKGTDPSAIQGLQDVVTALSVREAAALGALLLEAEVDPVPWVRLAADREQQARRRLDELLKRFHGPEGGDPGLQTTLRGPRRLRQACGDQLLTEVTGVSFWMYFDGGIPAPTDFSDADVEVLLGLPGLESIRAENSRLSDAGVERLASMPRLREFHLSGCVNLTDASLRAIARPELHAVDVTHASKVTDAGIAALANCPHLEELRLEKTGVTSESLSTIGKLVAVGELNLAHTAVCEGLDQLRSLDRLKRLRLAYLGDAAHPIPARSLSFLSRLKQLESLELEETAAGRVELRQLLELKTLSIGHPSLKEVVLVDLPRIEMLGVASPWFPSADAVRLESLKIERLSGLKQLWLRGLTPAAADGLAAGLAGSPDLRDLALSGSAITDPLAAAVGRMGKLESLSLDRSPVTDVQLANILRTGSRLHRLDGDGSQLTDAALQRLAARGGIKTLTLRNLKLADASALGESHSIEAISLIDCQIERLELSGNSALRSLEVTSGRLGGLQLDQCSKLERLSMLAVKMDKLQVYSCRSLSSIFGGDKTNLGIAELSRLPNLEGLTIQEGSSVGELRLDNLPALAHVSFWAADVSLQPLEALVQLPALKELDVSGAKLGDDAAAVIGRMTGLQILGASSEFTFQGLLHLRRLPKLQELRLYRRKQADWTEEEAEQMFSKVRDTVVFSLD